MGIKKIVIKILILLLLFLIICLLLYKSKPIECDLTHCEYADKYSKRYAVDIYQILAVIKAESNGDSNAVSSAGAVGLMQLMPRTAEYIRDMYNEEYNEMDSFDPEINIMLGTRYLLYLSFKFSGDMLFAAYNAGEGNVATWISMGITTETIPFFETRTYVNRVNYYIKEYKDRYYLY